MSAYVEALKTAAMFFPFIAVIISIPFILVQYHKFGSISFLKSLVLYSFVLYFLCAYFVVILPLPDKSVVARLTSPRCQLIPFRFVTDFIRETPLKLSNPSTYFSAIKDTSFLVPAYNILLTLPFGVYLRYYFKTSLKKTILLSFLLSLFYELTQLSGLYFIYPRSYRLFDVDDLFLNTLGGFLGYLCAPLAIKHLPEREELEAKSRVKGRKVSGLRRATALMLDAFLYSSITSLIVFLFPSAKAFELVSAVTAFLYFVAVPYLLKGSTLGEKFLNLRITDTNGKNSFLRLLFRTALFLVSYIAVPIVLIIAGIAFYSIGANERIRGYIVLTYAAIAASYYLCVGIKYLFTNRPMLYEKLSKTKMISTIDINQKDYAKNHPCQEGNIEAVKENNKLNA